jgi:hypothetical protein
MYRRLFRFLIFLLSLLSLTEGAWAQHYFFIEADGQQPFYARWNGKLISSSASGFLLVPRVEDEKILLTIGFPRNQFPEQNFELTEMNRDRGFQLKNFGEKGWGLFDRTSLAVIMPVSANTEKLMDVSKTLDKSFASVLAEVTGDSTLREPRQEPKAPVAAKKQVLTVSTPLRDSLIKDDRMKRFDISNMLLMENDQIKVMEYLVWNEVGGIDTVRAEINKLLPVQPAVTGSHPQEVITPKEPQSSSSISPKKIPVCDRPFAETKDIRSLQRKILGSSDINNQIALVIKEFKLKCYNSRQAMDLGWMIPEESERLRFFEALWGLVSDPDQFGQLETVFMKDENIKAFRKILGKN